jgi:hypothetical protein
MLKEAAAESRELKLTRLLADLVVVGGGLAGTCCAITAARAGIKVVLIQDRPVLGGNASSEVRLWALGATSHMGNNNRWAREGGVMGEIFVENLYRNPEGNPVIFDTVLLDLVTAEPNITLLLNTAVIAAQKGSVLSGAPPLFGGTPSKDDGRIAAVRAFCSQNATLYDVTAPLFCDASGDGILGYLTGAAFRMGAEASAEFGEGFAPSAEYGELLGHTIYFFSKDTGKPVRFTPPAYALADVTRIPKYRRFNTHEHGCELWWIEYGGRLDTVHETEAIKWELWRIVYGVWNHIKNAGEFPEAETLTLEWVGLIPGKRESRRFDGDYMLNQRDIIEQRQHPDAVSYGGWAIDLHPADGIFSEKPSCTQWHSRGVYQIPYRCLYSRNVPNLFLAGRIISASHVAHGSTRVQATCANSAQAVGMAAALCVRDGRLPRDLLAAERMAELQAALLAAGQFIPGLRLTDPADLARRAEISATSRMLLAQLPADGPRLALDASRAQMLPLDAGTAPAVTFLVDVARATTLVLELRTSNRPDNYTPDVVLDRVEISLAPGERQPVTARFAAQIDQARYAFYCLLRNPDIAVHASETRLTGILAVVNRHDPAVAKSTVQTPPAEIGVETFEFWTPGRRPGGHNLAVRIEPPLDLFGPANVINGVARPTSGPNAWVAAADDPAPRLTLRWAQPQTIGRLELSWDTDHDHPMETVVLGHSERAMPFCVSHYRVYDGAGRLVAERQGNYQTRNTIHFSPPLVTDAIGIEALASHGPTPAALFAVRCD